MAKKKSTKKTTRRRRSAPGMGGNVKLPVVGSVPVVSVAAGAAADRLGTQLTQMLDKPGASPYVSAAARAPEYLVPLLVGWVTKKRDLVAYGIGGLGSRLVAVAQALK